MNSSPQNPNPTAIGRVLVFLANLVKPGFSAAFDRLTWDRARLESYQLERLQNIVAHAYEHSPMYRKLYDAAGVKPSDLKTLRDMEKFPVVSKAMLRQGLADKTIFTEPEMPAGTVLEPTTGSTGNPLTLYIDKYAHHERLIGALRAMWMTGAFPHKRFAFLWRKKGLSRGQRIRQKLGLFKFIPVVDIQNASGSAVGRGDLRAIIDDLVAFRPQIIRGYTSALWLIAQYVKKHNIELRPESVIISAEYLPDTWRDDMESAFKCPVHNLYGGSEAAPIALSFDNDRNLMVFEDFYHTEIVDNDGRRAEPGNFGRIVVSDYASRYMPLIRYEIGDVAEWSREHRGGFPMFREVKGRINDLFVLPGGRVVFSHNWHIYLRDLKSVSKFKVVQKALDRIEITLEKAETGIDWNDELKTLRATVESAFGSDIHFVWELVDSIPLDAGGKFRPVRSELDSSAILKSASNSYIEQLREYPLSSHAAWEIADKSNVLKLDWNEADMDIPESVKKPMRDFIDHGKLNWYPDVANRELIGEIAKYAGVRDEQVQYFEGSDCGLDYVVRTFMQAGDEAILAAPTYDNFRVYVESVGGLPKFAYGKDLFAADTESIISAKTDKTRIVYIVNPNNPTGTLYTNEQIEEILKAFPHAIVIIDEAYGEFSGTTAIPLLGKYDNLLVSRSFAKAFGLASLRIGYVLAAPETIRHINKIRNGKNVPALGQIGALAALRNRQYMDEYVADVRKARDFICQELGMIGFETRPTQGNFILVKTPDAKKFQDAFLSKQVFVRGLGHLPAMNGYVRVSIPGMRGAEIFINRAKELRSEGIL